MKDFLVNLLFSPDFSLSPRTIIILISILFLNLLKIIHDNQSEIRELSEAIHAISVKLDDMQRSTDERFKESERKNNKRIRAELKDKISQSYRYYHSLGKINDMELDALEDLIEEYEEAGGENSFVHSIVQKEMYTWEKVTRI